MLIRVDKCITSGIKKVSTSSFHFQSMLFINSKIMPPVNNGESFKYLGRFFNFDIDNKDHEEILKSSLQTMLKTVDSLYIHPKNKLLLYHLYSLSKISWHFTVTDLGKTWISENLDNIVSKYFRQWLELPISATLSSIVLSSNKFGLALQLPSVKFQQCQTVLRSSLKSSKNEALVRVWRYTNCGSNIQYDIYENTKQVLKSIRTEHTGRLQTGLQSQGFTISFLLTHSL